MRRRDFLVWLGATALASVEDAAAQHSSPASVPVVGVLTPAESDRTDVFDAIRQGFREHGYTEGRNIRLEFRLARGDYSALPRLAAELVSLPADVIVTDGGTAVAQAAIAATKTIPIVMGTIGDPVARGFVASLSRPGGNVTGFTLLTGDLSVKRLELLRTAFPGADRATVLLNPLNRGSVIDFGRLTEIAPSLRLRLVRVEAPNPDAIRSLAPASMISPVLVLPDAMFWNRRVDIVALITAARAPALYPEREYADVGGLVAYGPNVPDNFRRAAGYVDRILKGASPGELPVQQPAKFELVVNLKAARALGLDLSPTLLARADEVIE